MCDKKLCADIISSGAHNWYVVVHRGIQYKIVEYIGS